MNRFKYRICWAFLFCVIFILITLNLENIYLRPYSSTGALPVIYRQQDILSQIEEKIYTKLNINDVFSSRCNDNLSVSCPTWSIVQLIGQNTVYVGDTIRLNVFMFDGYGIPKIVGGDHLRARLYNDTIKAYTSASITDHNNGTYTVHVQALWPGSATLEVELLYPKEIIASILRLRKLWRFKDNKAVFQKFNFTEQTSCDTDEYELRRDTGHTEVCDFSYWGKSIPWYCVKPQTGNLSCNDWLSSTRDWDIFTTYINTCEFHIATRERFRIGSAINIKVLQTHARRKKPKIPCSEYNKTKLWFHEETVGYFYKGKWIYRHCEGGSYNTGICLRNTTLYFWGDSTLRQWFEYLKTKLQCKCKVLETLGPAFWHCKRLCFCKRFNTTVIYIPHNLPVTPVSKSHLANFHSKTLQQTVNDFGKVEKRIIVLHLYAHLQTTNLKFFAAHILAIRKSIEHLLQEDCDTRVFIKLPHTHRDYKHKLWMILQPDYMGYLHTAIIRSLFDGLHDKITVLNTRDATNAARSLPLHPRRMVLAAMMDKLLTYICNDKTKLEF